MLSLFIKSNHFCLEIFQKHCMVRGEDLSAATLTPTTGGASSCFESPFLDSVEEGPLGKTKQEKIDFSPQQVCPRCEVRFLLLEVLRERETLFSRHRKAPKKVLGVPFEIIITSRARLPCLWRGTLPSQILWCPLLTGSGNAAATV